MTLQVAERLLYLFAFVFGSVIGSFLNVVIHRLPLEMSIVRPPSHCPSCNQPIRWFWNVPLLGWLALRGKCAACKAPISIRYPFVELLTGLLGLAVAMRYGLSPEALFQFAFVAALVVVTFIDLDHMIIPDEISLGGIVVGLLGQLIFDLQALPAADWGAVLRWLADGRFASGLLAAVVGGGGFWLLAVAFEKLRGVEGLGFGDVKLMAMIGAFTFPLGILQTILVGSLLGSVIGVAYIVLSGKGAQARIPFGPFLSIGAMSVALFPELMDWILTAGVALR